MKGKLTVFKHAIEASCNIYFGIIILLVLNNNCLSQVPTLPTVQLPVPALPGLPILPGNNATGNYLPNMNSTVLPDPQIQLQIRQPIDIQKELMETPLYREYIEWLNRSKYYREAFNELMKMNPDSFRLSEAQFIVENAYYNNTYKYSDYLSAVKFYVSVVKQILAKEKLKETDNLAVNYALQKLFQVPVTIEDKKTKKKFLFRPFVYDFNDWNGDLDYSNLFTFKLLRTHKGQCSSMPRFYLIIAQEMGAKANLSLAPQHSFIQFPISKGKLLNFEVTNGKLVTTNWLLQSGFITAAALKNKIYLDTLSSRQLFAQVLMDLLLGYLHKYSFDEYTTALLNKILELSPKNIGALSIDANYKRDRAKILIIDAGKPPFKELSNYPEPYKAYLEMKIAFDRIDNLGYQDMPDAAYKIWLKSIETEKLKQETIEVQERYNAQINRLKKTKVIVTNKRND